MFPGRQYRDTLDALLQAPLFTLGICIWSTVPFIVLVSLIKENIINIKVELLEKNKRVGGVIGAFIVALAVGFSNNIPQTTGGVNFGIVFSPLYAGASMLIGYYLGRIIFLLYTYRTESD